MPCSCMRGARGRSAGLGPVPGFVSFPIPLSRPRSPRCISGSSRPAVPHSRLLVHHSMWSLRSGGLGPVALEVFTACPLRVCAHALSLRPRPSALPGSVWRAQFAWFRCRAPVGLFHAVRAPPLFLPRSRAPSGLFFLGGGRPGPVPPMPGLGSCAPRRAGLCVRGGRAPGGGGRGGACVPPPPGVARGA